MPISILEACVLKDSQVKVRGSTYISEHLRNRLLTKTAAVLVTSSLDAEKIQQNFPNFHPLTYIFLSLP